MRNQVSPVNRKPLTLPKPMTLEQFTKALLSVPKAEAEQKAAEHDRKKRGRKKA